jgi:hypothetical protein
MAQKPAPKKVYRTSNGKIVDMDLLRQKNELTPAVGNVRVNARGDELGPGGKIVRKREDILKDFYAQADAEAAAMAVKKQPTPATKSVSTELFNDEEE